MKKNKLYLFEKELKFSNNEKKAFLESMRQFAEFRNSVYRQGKLSELAEQLGDLIESAEAFTLQETQDGFDQISVNRDLKEIKTDFKIFEKAASEMSQLQQRLENAYENIGHKLGKYYKL